MLGCLALLASVAPGPSEAARLGARRGAPASALQEGLAEVEGQAPADSKTVDGPDCGNVKQVITHWAHAKKVGRAAGAAKGAVMQADRVSDLADKALEKAKEIGAKVGEGGEPPEAVAKAVEEAETASSDLTGASTELGTELDAFNAKRSGAEWPEGVPDEDSLKLKELTEKTNDAAKNVQGLAANALARAKKAEAAAKQKKTEAATEVAAFYAKGQGRLEESKDVSQKAGWLLDDAKAKVAKATATAADLGSDEKVTEEALGADGSQKPVLQALAENVKSTAAGVTEADTELDAAVKELTAAQGELEGILAPMKEVSDAVATGGDVSELMKEEQAITEAEGTLTKFDLVVQTVESKMQTLEGRVDKLDQIQKQAESKLKGP